MKPFPAIAGLRISPKSFSFEPRPPRPCGPGLPGLAPVDRSRSRGSAPHAIRPSPLSKPADTDPDPGPHLRLGRLRHWPLSRGDVDKTAPNASKKALHVATRRQARQ
jgi:hypothetical protein